MPELELLEELELELDDEDELLLELDDEELLEELLLELDDEELLLELDDELLELELLEPGSSGPPQAAIVVITEAKSAALRLLAVVGSMRLKMKPSSQTQGILRILFD